MTINTKSIQKQSEVTDGIRICIMRRIKPEFVFDMWIPHLAPSTKLLKKYHDSELSWEQYEKEFAKEVLHKDNKYLDVLVTIAKEYPVTLLCWEEESEKCHRRLVAEFLLKQNPELETTIA